MVLKKSSKLAGKKKSPSRVRSGGIKCIRKSGDNEILKPDWSLIVVTIIILASFLIRVSLIDYSFYYSHSDFLFRPAEEFVTEGRLPMEFSFIGDTGARLGPILVYLFSVFLFIWNNIYTLYIFSIALWCIAAFFVYKIGREFFGAHAGLIASIFMSFHALSLFATTDNSEGVFAAPFIAMFIYTLFKVKFKEDTRYWILCFFSIGFLLQTHVSAFSCLLILAAFMLFRPKLDMRHISIGVLVLTILFLPCLINLVKTDFRDIHQIYGYLSESSDKSYGLTNRHLKLNLIYLPEDTSYLQFSRLFCISLIYFIPFLVYNGFRCENTEKVKKYSLLLLVFIFSYLWLTFFPYVSFYSLTFVFTVTCLISAEFLSSVMNFFQRKPLLVAVTYLVVFFWIFNNITGVKNFLYENRTGAGAYFKLEKKVAEAILEHSQRGTVEKPNITEEEYSHFYSRFGEDTLFYYRKMLGGGITERLLKGEKWYPADKNKIYLIIPKNKLPFKEVKAEFSEEIDDYVLINFENEINKTIKFSTVNHDGWFLKEFNDSGWKTTWLPISSCPFGLINRSCLGMKVYNDKVPEEGIFLRLILTNSDANLNKSLLISSSSVLFLREVYINGFRIYNSNSTNPAEFNHSYELPNIKKYLAHGENIIGIHLKHEVNVNNVINVFVLTEK